MSDKVNVYLIGLGKRNNSRLYYPNSALNTLSSILSRMDDVKLKVTDASIDTIDFNQKPDLVAISVGHTPEVPKAYAIALRLKDNGAKILLGGLHPSYNPEEAKRFGSVFIGPAENNLGEVIDDLKKGALKPEYHGYGPFMIISASRFTDYVNPRNFKKVVTTIIAAVGCNNSCPWCTSKLPGMRRIERPLEEVIDEISLWQGQTVNILDPNINQNMTRFKELMKGIIPLNVKWYSEMSTAGLDDEVMDLMHESGCSGVLIGFESLHSENKGQVGKACYDINNYHAIIRGLHDRGIPIRGSFVFGFDQDKPSIFRETVDFVIENKIDAPLFAVLTPYIGTQMWNQFNEQGRLLGTDGRLITKPDADFPDAWKYFDRYNTVFVPANMRPEELEAGRKWAKYEACTPKNTYHRLHNNPAANPTRLAGMFNIADNAFRTIRNAIDPRLRIGVKDYRKLVND